MFRITPPISMSTGAFQSLPEQVLIPIKLNEPTILKLLPSETYRPFGRYKVEIFRKNQISLTPISTLYWTVPNQTNSKYIDLVVSDPTKPIPINLPTSELSKMIPEYPYRLENNIIYWIDENDRPAVGETVSILIIPYVTFEDLIDQQ
jgi:hypothetical protein